MHRVKFGNVDKLSDNILLTEYCFCICECDTEI